MKLVHYIFFCFATLQLIAQTPYPKQISEYDSLAKYFIERQPVQSLIYAHQGYKESYNHADTSNIAYFSMLIGVAHKRLANYDSALYYYNINLNLNQKQKYTLGVAGAYNNIAFVYKLLGKYELSVEYYLKALSENEKTNNTKNQTIILNNIGNVFSDQEQFNEALRYYRLSADIAEKYGYHDAYAQTCNNIGDIFFKQKQYDSAEKKFREAYSIKKKYNKQRMMASAYGNLSKVLYAKKQYDSAVFYAQKSLDAYNSYQDVNGANTAKIHLNLCLSQLHQQDKNKIKENYWDIIRNARQHKDKNNLITAYNNISRYYANQKNMDSAYFYLLQYIICKDSSHNMQVSEKINELLTKYETAQKQRHIDSLTHQNSLHEEQKKQTQLKANIAVTGFISFLALTLLFMYLYYIKRKHHNEITQKNALIQQSLHHRELLIKEIHHRVKNNLQIISSLLNLQLHLAKENVEELVKNSQDRIYAMSIIHEKLYQSENLEAIDLKEYIEKLMLYFEQSYELDKCNISLQTNISSPLALDIDTLIPCGLIINELITNSIKYAFQPEQQGIIQIWTELKDKYCTLYIKDNGKGLPKDFNPNESRTLGSRLIKGFAQQLKAELQYHSAQGTMVSLTFAI